MKIAEVLAQFAIETPSESIPPRVIEAVKCAATDCISCILAGSRSDVTCIANSFVVQNGSSPAASILGSVRRVSLPDAAFINGVAGHSLDYDDISWSLYGHPTIAVLPAALAIAEMRLSSGRALLDALAIGIEVAAKIGSYANPIHYEAGWHATSTIGIFGAVVACARLLDATVEQTKTALGIAASMSSGLQQNFGSMTKPFHAGNANKAAVVAIQLSLAGMSSDEDIFEGRLGWFPVMARTVAPDPQVLLSTLGSTWEAICPGIVLKRYPSCGATSCALDAINDLCNSESFTWNDVERVECFAHPLALNVLKHPSPSSPLEGKFSMQFCLAVALIDGPPQIQHFTGQWINDERIRQLLPRISLLSEQTFSVPSGADAIPAKVRIVLSDGRIFDKTVMEPYGDPRRPLTMEMRKSKFKECTLDMMTKSQATLTWDYLNRLDQQSNIAELFPLTFPNN